MRATLAADFKLQPYWWEAAPPEDTRKVALPKSVDVAIVGAGYCGLCCALELAKNGVEVAVFDAGPLGSGASTRSGGMVTGGQKFVVSGAIKGVSAEQSNHMLADARESLALFETRVATYNLDADYQRCGRIILAATRRHYGRLEGWATLLRQKTGARVSLLPPEMLRGEVPGTRFFGGLLIPEYGGVHTAKYHRSLRQAAAGKGASLHSHAAVTGVRDLGGRYLLQTARGEVEARRVFVATNGYTGGLVPFLQRRIIPVASYMIATQPLPQGMMDHFFPQRRMLSDTRKDLAYFRPSPDGTRILFGARPSIFEIDERIAAPHLHAQLCEIWPEAADLKITHCWRGHVGMSMDRVPHLGAVDGLHYAVGCNGSGVAMMSYLGYQSARKLLGRQNRPSAFEGLPFPSPPLYSGNPWFVPITAGWYRLRDKVDALLG